jgi:hypothetical protein
MSVSSPDFVVGVVAHEKRRTRAERLAGKVRADLIMTDGGPKPLGCEANHRRVWSGLDAFNAEWCVTLEDDAIPVDGFRDQLAQALAVAPAPYISLYLGRGFPRQWQKRFGETILAATPDTCWAMTSGWLWHAVGIAVRADLVPGMLNHLDRAIGVPVDEAIGQHARNTNQPVAYTLPSLVDHADGPTIHIHQDGQPRPPGRKAWTTGARTTWNNKTIDMA